MSISRLPFSSGDRWSGPFIVSIVAVGIGLWVVGVDGLPFLRSFLVSGGAADGSSAIDQAIGRHNDVMKTSTDRFSGRSLFVMPPPHPRKAPPAPPPPPPRVEPVSPPAPPPPPTDYTGPKPTGMVGDIVYFETLAIRIGEEKNGIKVLGVEPPSNVRVMHMKGTYSVPIWTPTDWSKLSSAPISRASPITRAVTVPPKAPTAPPGNEIAPAAPVSAPVDAPIVATSGGASDEAAEEVPMPVAEPVRELATVPPAPATAPAPAQTVPAFSSVTPIAPIEPISPSSALPPALTPQQIQEMTPAQISVALARISRARQQPGLDAASQARLREEFTALRDRQKAPSP